ncbi:MAG: hypothetical protein ABIN94_07305 [Ferruginibacter sp.]
MKKHISLIIATACTICLVWSCSKDIDHVAPTSSPEGFAYIKIGHFAPNFGTILNGKDSFNVYVGGTTQAPGTKLNGAFLTYGSIFPSTTNLYAAVPAGTQFIRITVNGIANGVTIPDSLTLKSFTKTLTAGSYYSLIFTDSLLSANESKQIFVQDNFAIADTMHYSIRFVHAIVNDTLGQNVDVYSTRLGANIFTNVSPGAVTAFTAEPYNIVADTFIVRRTGIPFELARLNAAILARQRAITLVYKGQPATTTGTKARSLVLFNNQ